MTFVFALALGLGFVRGSVALAGPTADTAVSNPFQEGGAATKGDEDKSGDDDDAPASNDDQGDDQGDEDDGPGPESSLHALTCLDGDATGGRRKGVQRRDFLKKHRFELSGVGGFYASDALSSTYSYGGALAFFPSEDFGLEVLVTRSPIQFRLEDSYDSFSKETHFQPSIAWQGIFSMMWSPIHAKFKFTEQTIIHGDLFAVAGAGRTFDDSVLGLTWEAGVGLKLYLAKYVSFRLDVRDFLLPQEVLGRDRITNNVTVLGGLGFWVL
ncbi:MAG TPA: outer membrane beta-barrel domain-containing protein [Polyangia bacterium]|nr:outer membrane beta-barrel domain-containing protein [Polyangia bacterium]